MPPLRSTPCSWTRPSRTAGARPKANDQNTDPLPEPEQPATRVCGPMASRHVLPVLTTPQDDRVERRRCLSGTCLERDAELVADREGQQYVARAGHLDPNAGGPET